MRKKFLSGLLLCCWLPLTEAAPKQLTDKELAVLADKVDRAEQLFRRGKYEDALTLYKEVYEASEEPTMLFSTAQCYFQLQRYQEAASAYRKFLVDLPVSDFSEMAKKNLAISESYLPKVTPTETQPTTSNGDAKHKPSFFYLGAGAAGALWAITGGSALLLATGASTAQSEGDFSAAANKRATAKVLGVTSDLMFVSGAGLAVAGYLLSKKDNERAAQIALTPTQITLSVRF